MLLAARLSGIIMFGILRILGLSAVLALVAMPALGGETPRERIAELNAKGDGDAGGE